MRLRPLSKPLGMTVAELKKHIADWPDADMYGDPTTVWVETGKGESGPCVNLQILNFRKCSNHESSDLLLCSGRWDL